MARSGQTLFNKRLTLKQRDVLILLGSFTEEGEGWLTARGLCDAAVDAGVLTDDFEWGDVSVGSLRDTLALLESYSLVERDRSKAPHRWMLSDLGREWMDSPPGLSHEVEIKGRQRYVRGVSDRLALLTPRGLPHGTAAKYNHDACRCVLCREAKRRAQLHYRQRVYAERRGEA